jgi:hypothetical protein
MMHTGGAGVAGLYRENGGRSGFAEIPKPEAKGGFRMDGQMGVRNFLRNPW